ncbi:uncharacterized protein LOC110119055 [Ceratitis capitata]|uniref:uncharacterized protein LOC110119055 n=1 Tax=Ceratitis capitata TaxID=7213 RepID=UPI000A11AF8C|nr:uncharacterized protein LOC110119055 [Ceratitis capitata]
MLRRSAEPKHDNGTQYSLSRPLAAATATALSSAPSRPGRQTKNTPLGRRADEQRSRQTAYNPPASHQPSAISRHHGLKQSNRHAGGQTTRPYSEQFGIANDGVEPPQTMSKHHP